MADIEWYRQQSWDQDAASNFEVRLSRARRRGEYLRIQALTLADTCLAKNARPAIELAKRNLERDPEGIFAAQMHAVIARASVKLGDVEAAIVAYRDAVRLEHARPNVRGYYYLEFAWLIAANSISDLYDEALEAMENNKADQGLIFPANQYRYFASLAFIAADTDDMSTARRKATHALTAASAERGPFRRLPAAGIVKSEKAFHRQRLELLAR